MSARLPRNGDDLLQMRREGWRPDGLVLVSLIGDLGFANYSLYADPALQYDWRMLVDLDVELVVDTSVPFGAVVRTLADIAGVVPATLSLYFVDGPRVDCGRSRYVLISINPSSGTTMFDWAPVSALAASPDSTRIAKRLWRELGSAIPTPLDTALSRLQPLLEKELRDGTDDS